ncbi:hypothetical protein CBF23_002930 [Marinomonas agarivorans]|nr:hypothetical protein CBF23_002930 [Marinomonas agarivorans]
MTLIILFFILTAGLKSGNKMIALATYLDEIKHIIPPAAELNLAVIEGGFSNHALLLQWHNQPRCVLRIPELPKKAFLLCPKAEKRALDQAVVELLSPPCWYFNTTSGVMVSQYVPQQPFDWQIQHDELNVVRLANCLQQIHQGPSNHAGYRLEHVINHYLDNVMHYMQEPETTTPPILAESLTKEAHWLRTFAQPYCQQIPDYKPVMCHNDLNPKNCLADERHFWVIDWEYAGEGDALFDIALVFASHNFTPAQKDLFFQHYPSPLTDNALAEVIENYQHLYKIREMAWILLKCATSKQGDNLVYYDTFKQELLNA